ncbi:MAG: OmpH family outer membrane protein [Verrucomicrobiales bacterium]|nr:OmpH family outer membrane protein [Verrucomicrobiales bacterium]
MTMKRYLPLSILAGLAFWATFGQTANAQGENLRISVVDMQSALNDYYKTEQEVEKINALAKDKRKSLDERQADYQALTNQLAELDKTARDSVLAQAKREEAFAKLQTVVQERATKAREIQDAQRKYQAEILQARQTMEATLVAEIRDVLNAMVQGKGYDLVLDRSFLPKANKVILFDSEKVPNLTVELIAALNANAPAGWVPPSKRPNENTTTNTPGGAAPAAPETGEAP